MTTDTAIRPSVSERALAGAVPAASGARHDIYAKIHRALRLFMTDTLVRVGRLDTDDRAELAATLEQLRTLLVMCRGHADSENRFVHTAIEARAAGATARFGEDHHEHLAAIEALEAEAATLAVAPSAALALRLYRHLALFVAENFEHMQREETVLNQALWALYDDAGIDAIEHAIVADLPPEKMQLVLRWMTPALPPAERAAWLAGMQAAMPPEAFRGVLDLVRPTLDEHGWAKLAAALALPGRPAAMAG
jgi:hypothetical protein